MTTSDLLRSDVSDQLQVLTCEIVVDVLPGLAAADYCFCYRVKRTAAGPDEWREVFAYPAVDFAMRGAHPGWPGEDPHGHDGLHHHVAKYGPQGDKTLLVVAFDREVAFGAEYVFHYRCRTRVETAQNKSVFGGTGAIWYWCAHEYPVNAITVTMRMPQGVTIVATHPETPTLTDVEPQGNYRRAIAMFTKSALAPREFVVSLVTTEWRRLGVPVRYARPVELGGAVSVGVVGSLLAALILSLF